MPSRSEGIPYASAVCRKHMGCLRSHKVAYFISACEAPETSAEVLALAVGNHQPLVAQQCIVQQSHGHFSSTPWSGVVLLPMHHRTVADQFVTAGLRRGIKRINALPNAFAGWESPVLFHHLPTKIHEIPARAPIQAPRRTMMSLCGEDFFSAGTGSSQHLDGGDFFSFLHFGKFILLG